jgi:chromate transporter
MAIHVGHARAGWPGLVVAGACFILPAALIVTVLAWAYVRFGSVPEAAGLLYGVKPVVIAVVLQALWRLGRTAVTSAMLATVAALAIVATVIGLDEIAVLAAAGALTALVRHGRGQGAHGQTSPPDAGVSAIAPPVAPIALAQSGAAAAAGGTAAAGAAAFGLWPLFTFFVKVGAVLFGSGYVLLAFLRSGLVVERGWLTETQLLDAVAIGQVTPGPVFTTATFIGYLLAGGAGAAVATLGIFLPAFVFVALSGPLIPRLRRSRVAGAVLDGVNAASLALMAVVTVQLGAAALVDLPTIVLALVSGVLLVRWRVNSVWLVTGGAIAGMLLQVGFGGAQSAGTRVRASAARVFALTGPLERTSRDHARAPQWKSCPSAHSSPAPAFSSRNCSPLRLRTRPSTSSSPRTRRSGDVVSSSAWRSNRFGVTTMFTSPVSSSNVRKTNPFAVPGRCRQITSPATAMRDPPRTRSTSRAESTLLGARRDRRCRIGWPLSDTPVIR